MTRIYNHYSNNFSRGISSDPMVWPQGSYYDSENLYNDFSIGSLVLYWQIVPRWETIWWDTVAGFMPFVDNEWFLIWSAYIMTNGKVRDSNGTLLFTLYHPEPATAIKHGNKILRKQGEMVHTTNLDGTWYTGYTYTLTWATNTECYLSYGNNTYIGSGNKVYVLSTYDLSGTFTHRLLLRDWDVVLWLHRIGMYIYVVTNNNVYIWQWVTSEPEYVIPSNYNIYWSWVYNNTIYTISQQAKYFYIHVLNGQVLDLVIKSNWDTWDKRFTLKSIAKRNIVIEQDHWLYWIWNNTLYRLASPWAGMPIAITKENILIGYNYRVSESFIFDISNKKYYIITENYSTNTKNQWYIELHPHTDNVVAQKKKADNVRVSYELDSQSLLVVSSKKNQNKWLYYTFFCEYNTAITLPTQWSVYRLWSIDFTVIKTTEKVLWSKRHIMIETQAIGTWTTNNTVTNTILSSTTTTITKQSGTGESSISFVYFSEYQIVRIIEDSGVSSTTVKLWSEEYYIYQLRFDLLGNNTRPKLYDVTYWYANIERDI